MSKRWKKTSPYIFEQFAMELCDMTDTGELPKHGNQDISYSLYLQQKRLNARSLAMTYELIPRGHFAEGGGYGKGWRDAHYNSKLEYRSCRMIKRFFSNGKQVRKDVQDSLFYQIITDINEVQIIADDSYVCPNCGAISKISDMLSGCKNCGTYFKMSDLYPRVTNFFFIRDSGKTSDELKSNISRIIIPSMVVCIIAVVAFRLSEMSGMGGALEIIGAIVSGVLGGAMLGAILGYVGWAFMMLGRVFGEAGKSVPMLVNTAGSEKRYVSYMQQISPEFSYEYFKDKVVSLLKMILYSDDVMNLPNYAGCPLGGMFHNIVDASYTGAVALNHFEVRNGYCIVNVDVYMDVMYDNQGKLSNRRNKFNMSLTKNITRPINYYYSVKKIQCKGCGGSFDATKQRNCPNCGNWYDATDDDWIVTGVQRG